MQLKHFLITNLIIYMLIRLHFSLDDFYDLFFYWNRLERKSMHNRTFYCSLLIELVVFVVKVLLGIYQKLMVHVFEYVVASIKINY